MMRRAMWGVLWLLVVGPAFLNAEGLALVVGVNDCPVFKLQDGSRPRPLRGAESDAQQMAETLVVQMGFTKANVQLLMGRDATAAALREAFAKLRTQLRPEDVFVFHFSGHGTQVPDQMPFDEADGLDEGLCLSDTDAQGKNLILDDDLGLGLDELPAKSVTVILDCCHAGTGIKSADDEVATRFLPFSPMASAVPLPAPRAEQPWRDLRSATKSLDREVSAYFACKPEQQAFERRLPGMKAPARAGQFTHFLLEGLQQHKSDANHDGVLTNRELLDYAKRQLDETFNQTRTNVVERQEPFLEADRAEAAVFGGLAKTRSQKGD